MPPHSLEFTTFIFFFFSLRGGHLSSFFRVCQRCVCGGVSFSFSSFRGKGENTNADTLFFILHFNLPWPSMSTTLLELQAELLSTSSQDLYSSATTTTTTSFLLPLGVAAPTMSFETSFRPSSKAVGASSMPNLPALFICFMLFLQTYLALANPAAAAAASALFPGYKTPSRSGNGKNTNEGSGSDKHARLNSDNNYYDVILPRQQRQQSVGSTCDGSEGQWNCMTTSWQRCAAGRWSVVVDMADGTNCHPGGLTWDFAIEDRRGQGGGNGGGRATSSAFPGSGWGLRGGIGGGGGGGGKYSLGEWSLVVFGGLGLVVGGWV
ncbi:hypothetical protein MCOR34_009136 [Pyricularia oryzae]|nr:hypothetical protein MCOR34_009136 [Pyricularia oryzae]KAI6454822.1 hypothetical protein MCOR17_008911 [Pyricularia oryzae]KAI6481456.1 hypothetical protein MCOR11_011375 [Pyricularia oryzae]